MSDERTPTPDDRLAEGLSSPMPLNYAAPDPAQDEQRHQASQAVDGVVDVTINFLAHGGELVAAGVTAGLEAAGGVISGLLDGV